MIDLTALAAKLTNAGIMDKAFYDMNRDEVMAMCAAVLAAHQPEHEAVPYIRYDMHEPTLVVPSNAADHFRRIHMRGAEARKVLYETLHMLGADYEMMRRYLGESWQEEVHQ